MNEEKFWNILREILDFGEFIVAVPNAVASANIVGKLSIGRDGKERVLDKDACHCHVHLEPAKISEFNFTYIDAGFGKEPCIELRTPQKETVLKLYLCESVETARIKFTTFSHKQADFVIGNW